MWVKFSKLKENKKFFGACIAIFMLGTGSAIASTGTAPNSVVAKLNMALIHSMKMGPSSSYESRFHALYPEISHAYDFSQIAHYSLGTAWDKLSAPEKKQFVQALTHTENCSNPAELFPIVWILNTHCSFLVFAVSMEQFRQENYRLIHL